MSWSCSWVTIPLTRRVGTTIEKDADVVSTWLSSLLGAPQQENQTPATGHHRTKHSPQHPTGLLPRNCVETDKLRCVLNTWERPAGTAGSLWAGWGKLRFLPEVVGRNPAFPGRSPAEDLTEPPAAAALLPNFKHRPFLEAAGVFVSFKVGHSHIE